MKMLQLRSGKMKQSSLWLIAAAVASLASLVYIDIIVAALLFILASFKSEVVEAIRESRADVFIMPIDPPFTDEDKDEG